MPEQPLRALTSDELTSFVDDGVACAPNVIPDRWLDLAAKAVDQNLAAPTAIGDAISMREAGYLNDIFMWLANDRYRSYVLDSPVSTLAAQALGALGAIEVGFFYDQCFVKEPGTEVPTPWHHDLTFWPVEGTQLCSIWMPLDPVTTETSGLVYVAGSHRWKRRFKAITPDYNAYMINPDLDDVPDIDADRSAYDLRAWDMQPGDVLIFHPLVVHGSAGNRSTTTRRRALATRWYGDDVIYRDLPHTMPLPPGHGLVDGDRLSGEVFPRFGPTATRAGATSA